MTTLAEIKKVHQRDADSSDDFMPAFQECHDARRQLIDWVERLLPYAKSLQVRGDMLPTPVLSALLREISGESP